MDLVMGIKKGGSGGRNGDSGLFVV